eukprot:scaffold36701_cov328-Amphora_coffeaeformis.AAC.1
MPYANVRNFSNDDVTFGRLSWEPPLLLPSMFPLCNELRDPCSVKDCAKPAKGKAVNKSQRGEGKTTFSLGARAAALLYQCCCRIRSLTHSWVYLSCGGVPYRTMPFVTAIECFQSSNSHHQGRKNLVRMARQRDQKELL